MAATSLSMNAVSCRICQDCCDQGAIGFRLKTGGLADPVLNEDACIGCGACATACPAGAITLQRAQHLEAAE